MALVHGTTDGDGLDMDMPYLLSQSVQMWHCNGLAARIIQNRKAIGVLKRHQV